MSLKTLQNGGGGSDFSTCELLAEQINSTSNPPTMVQHTVEDMSKYSFLLLTLEQVSTGNVAAQTTFPVVFAKNKANKGIGALYIPNQVLAVMQYVNETTVKLGALYNSANSHYARLYGIR